MYNPRHFVGVGVRKTVAYLCPLFLLVSLAEAQFQSPNAYDVLMYSATQQSTGTVPGIFTFNNGTPTALSKASLTQASNYGVALPMTQLTGVVANSIATSLSVIPLASPASGVITKVDPVTGAELPASGTLGPIFTERAETIGKHKFYIGFSNQDFHFRSLDGQSLKTLQLLDTGGRQSSLLSGSTTLTSFPATARVGTDVKLEQNVAFLTYGVTNRFDVSVGLPIVHSAISAATYDAQIYAGNGFNNTKTGNCWCVDTFTPGVRPDASTAIVPGLGGLVIPGQINYASSSQTGFGDMLLRFKGTVLERSNIALALGTDLRLPTGDARNFLGTGTTEVKPFLALSLYTKPLSHGIVFSPHINVGWQFAGQSILGGQILPTQVATGPPPSFGAPFTTTKGYLPDVFSWAVGTEVGLGRRNTLVLDVLGNQIGWVHGIANMMTDSRPNVPLASTSATPTLVNASGLVSAGRVSFGQYNGAFGYRAKVYQNLVLTFSLLVRLDHNGLTSRATPLIGAGYTF